MHLVSDRYVDFYGDIIDYKDLKIPKAIGLVTSINSGIVDFVTLVECREINCGAHEAIVFDIVIKVGQETVYDIRDVERIAAVFDKEDKYKPSVYALREDFPTTPHQYITNAEVPKCLCLYEESYDEIKLNWTPTQFLRRVSDWLSLTSKGKLHGEDQPLEPLLSSNGNKIILPYRLFSEEEKLKNALKVERLENETGNLILIADRPKAHDDKRSIHHALAIIGKPQVHGIIRKAPETLKELDSFLALAEIDLLGKLRSTLYQIHDNKLSAGAYDEHIIVVVYLPKIRESGLMHEAHDTWAFWLTKSVKELGVDLGLWEVRDGLISRLLGGFDKNRNGENTKVMQLSVVYSLSRQLAAAYNGIGDRISDKITLVGVGALGSQLFMNLIRSGSGEWTIIDNDYLMPHNLARHALIGSGVGRSKAECMEYWANDTIYGENIAHSITADILDPREHEAEVKKALEESDIILDISTSIAAERYLALDVQSKARRVSMFLNPAGNDAVLLAEDMERKNTLDFIEMQYYRSLVHMNLTEHLSSVEYLRYSNACRDTSNVISQENIAMYAALLSKAFRSAIQDSNGSIKIWSTKNDSFNVDYANIQTYEMERISCGDWTVCTDRYLLDRLKELRQQKLPNETGGVLIGSIDVQRKIVYVVDTVPSPLDSNEWPDSYIRGYKGLRSEIERINKITGNRLEYIGEWHSHPEGCGCKASSTDSKAFLWLANYMAIDGYPALMMICAEKTAFYIGQMSNCGFQV